MIKIPARVKIFDAIMIAIFASYSLLPVFWVITTSFKTNEELTRNGTLALPEHFFLGNYPEAWEAASFSDYFLNSVFVTVVTVAVIAFFAVLIAYCLCYLELFWKKVGKLHDPFRSDDPV